MSTYSMKEEDRAYVLDRLDREHIEELAEKIALSLELGHAIEACYQPGDATWYSLVFGRCTVLGAAGGGGDYPLSPPSSYIGQDRVFIAYVQPGSVASFGKHDDPEWVAMKLTDNRASALAIAALIKAVMDAES
jgi:hypothetical protein